ncbi:MAG: hypothetical protein J6P05_01655 [Lachnospiraceae bacterium]|nr:hypothetical protein [Lachnospiraceae bacterium]
MPKKGEKYRDSEWNVVEILGIGRNADNLEEVVIFFLLKIPDRYWILPIKDFVKRYKRSDTEKSKGRCDDSANKPAKSIPDNNSQLMDFLDASSVDQRLDILKRMKVQSLNDHMIDTMAVALDTEIPKGSIENRYSDLMSHLETRKKYEQHRR